MILNSTPDVNPENFSQPAQFLFDQVLLERETRKVKRSHDFMTIPLQALKEHQVFLNLAANYNLTFLYAMAFWCEPFSSGLIHRDLDAWAFNIPLNKPGGKQVWVDGISVEPILTTYGDTNKKPFELYPASTPHSVLGELLLDRPYFVNTNVLHFIDNSTNDSLRATLTVRFKGANPMLR